MFTCFESVFHWHHFFEERRTLFMKKYLAPEVETLTYAAEEAIALGSNLFNDAEFGGW